MMVNGFNWMKTFDARIRKEMCKCHISPTILP